MKFFDFYAQLFEVYEWKWYSQYFDIVTKGVPPRLLPLFSGAFRAIQYFQQLTLSVAYRW